MRDGQLLQKQEIDKMLVLRNHSTFDTYSECSLSAATFRPSWYKDATMLSALSVQFLDLHLPALIYDGRQRRHMLSRRYEH